jgi:Zn-dependent protease
VLQKILNKTITLCQIKGIDFKIHWSFIIVIVLVLFVGSDQYLNTGGTRQFFITFAILFFSVLIHELGHAITAKYLGVKPKDIIISALGGLARIESLKDKPEKEVLISSAGPIMNLILFLGSLFYVLVISKENIQISELNTFIYTDYFSIGYKIGFINLLFFILNLIPAFPMDGGRILRALLSIRLGNYKATKIASVIGRLVALFFFVVGAIYRIPGLIAVSALVYIMAAREAIVDLSVTDQ